MIEELLNFTLHRPPKGLKVLQVVISGKVPKVDRDDSSETEFADECKAFFEKNECEYDCINADGLQSLWDDRIYDMVIMRGVLQRQKEDFFSPKKLLELIYDHLSDNGRLICAENNRMGVSVLQGSLQNTNRPLEKASFEGSAPGFLRGELKTVFELAGYSQVNIRYPYPGVDEPYEIYSDSFLPGEHDRGALERALIREGVYNSFFDEFLVEALKKPSVKGICIYTSLHHRRKERFRTTRKVFLLPDGRRYEREFGIEGKSTDYLKKKLDMSERFAEYYSGFSLEINPWESEGNEILTESIGGDRLDSLLDEMVVSDNIEGFYVLLRRYMDTMRSPEGLKIHDKEEREKRRFSASAGFKKYFGSLSSTDEELLVNEDALEISNLAIRFQDLIVADRSWTITGADFLEDFAVPFSYLLYQPLEDYFSAVPTRPGAWKEDMYRRFEISEAKREIFKKMRKSFASEVYESRMQLQSKEGRGLYRERYYTDKHGDSVVIEVADEPGILEVIEVKSERGRDRSRSVNIQSDLEIKGKYYFYKRPAIIELGLKRSGEWVEITYRFTPMPQKIREDMRNLIEVSSIKAAEIESKPRFSLFK